jgi:crotonobetainyl-CoA:carnitine CoA-transferase CaiB-like acyl-CoA transferase
MIVETTHPQAGRTKAIGLPIKLSETPGGARRPAPLFGQHTREVLLEAGYSEAAVEGTGQGGGSRSRLGRMAMK